MRTSESLWVEPQQVTERSRADRIAAIYLRCQDFDIGELVMLFCLRNFGGKALEELDDPQLCKVERYVFRYQRPTGWSH